MDSNVSDGLHVNVIRRFSSFVEFEAGYEHENTKIQLAYDSPFRFEEPVDSELGIKINDYKDLIVDKFLAFFGRAEPRDAVDLFFILSLRVQSLAAVTPPWPGPLRVSFCALP